MWPTARAHTYTHTQGTDGKQKRTHTAKAMPYSLVVQLRQSGSHFAIEPVTSRRGNDRKARPATATTIISSYNNDNKKKNNNNNKHKISKQPLESVQANIFTTTTWCLEPSFISGFLRWLICCPASKVVTV